MRSLFIARCLGLVSVWRLAACWLIACLLAAGQSLAEERSAETLDVDLLVVGGSESACAAAVQAARLKVGSIALVNDIDWLGGQFTAEGLGAIDEWTIYQGRKTYFPRSGTFLEIMERIEDRLKQKYGMARPGNCFCAWTTCEPRDTERLFREWLAPYLAAAGGPIRLYEHFEPERVLVEGRTVRGVEFASTRPNIGRLVVRAKRTIDASDWGDVIRLSGAGYLRGPDLKSRFHEPGAPSDATAVEPNEMNPLTYCLVLRERDPSEQEPNIEKPAHFDERSYFGASLATKEEYEKVGWPRGTMRPFAPVWKDTILPNGPYSEPPTIYSHRRLVDRRHNRLAPGTELVLMNWPLQDYPTYNFPRPVVDELEATEPGASRKNLVDMTPAQRRIVLADAKRHALGLLYHLQTTAFAKEPNSPVHFRQMRLTDEFGTPDRLPLKPYLREALRTKTLYMLREQDVRDRDGIQSWAEHMAPDSLFGFQFNIDFHPTKRIYLDGEGKNTGPWAHIHSTLRNWGTHTDRAGFPLRSFVPVEFDGLLAAGKSLGVTSIVSSAVRLHGHGMLAGQASATIAAVSLATPCSTQDVARDERLVRRVQTLLVAPLPDPFTQRQVPGVLLWPYQDLPPDAPHFVAANQLAVRAILPGVAGLQDFVADSTVSRREAARAIVRAALAARAFSRFDYPADGRPAFRDIDTFDADFPHVESLLRWKVLNLPPDKTFEPDKLATRAWLQGLFTRLDWPSEGPSDETAVNRAEFAMRLWFAVAQRLSKVELHAASVADYLRPGHDADGDGRSDLDDPLPLDRDNDSLPELLDPDADGDGVADLLEMTGRLRRFNFTGAGSPRVPGYEDDYGDLFSTARGFGWNVDLRENHRRRGKLRDQVRDTFLFTRTTARWELEIENGEYDVTICIGDAGHEQPGQQVTVEGLPAAKDQDTAAGEFFIRTVRVRVNDGRLSVDLGANQPGKNTCLNWLRVVANDGRPPR